MGKSPPPSLQRWQPFWLLVLPAADIAVSMSMSMCACVWAAVPSPRAYARTSGTAPASSTQHSTSTSTSTNAPSCPPPNNRASSASSLPTNRGTSKGLLGPCHGERAAIR
ncbi:hypothetical protein BKA66DRAFT_444825 [Pyrenochaeta sp. MPI-SDFR-AT-0127]|nr:hypothetical protein BKA66DRAFT_444825 [Pyrenochaeta sp. MPI-SDFR-AT-0127]